MRSGDGLKMEDKGERGFRRITTYTVCIIHMYSASLYSKGKIFKAEDLTLCSQVKYLSEPYP